VTPYILTSLPERYVREGMFSAQYLFVTAAQHRIVVLAAYAAIAPLAIAAPVSLLHRDISVQAISIAVCMIASIAPTVVLKTLGLLRPIERRESMSMSVETDSRVLLLWRVPVIAYSVLSVAFVLRSWT
jgi:hypothetical protein